MQLFRLRRSPPNKVGAGAADAIFGDNARHGRCASRNAGPHGSGYGHFDVREVDTVSAYICRAFRCRRFSRRIVTVPPHCSKRCRSSCCRYHHFPVIAARRSFYVAVRRRFPLPIVERHRIELRRNTPSEHEMPHRIVRPSLSGRMRADDAFGLSMDKPNR